MIQIQTPERSWTEFYPIVSLELAGEGDIINPFGLSNLPQKVYGKYAAGTIAGQVWWVYVTVYKTKLRDV
jgi:hypothetical protein